MPPTTAHASAEIRRIILEQAFRAGVGHIGSALSIADIMAALLSTGLFQAEGPDRDRFVLSKGHAALALYAALYIGGRLDKDELDTYCSDGTPLGAHPEHVVDGIDFSTGSLGQGLSIGTGAALAARLRGSSQRVFVVMSDAELNEGSVWEAAMFARQHALANLTAIVDLNGQQAFGYTSDVMELDTAAVWRSFGWHVHEVDGHDVEALVDILGAPISQGPPSVVLAQTTFGSGVSYMERQIPWHYLPMNEDQLGQALAEVAG